MFKKILVGVDGSSCSDNALKYAVHLALQDKAELHLISAAEPLQPMVYPAAGPYSYVPQYQNDLHENLSMMIDKKVKELSESNEGLDVTGEVKDGKAVHVIKEASEGFDLVVIGHRGLGGVLSWVLGSVAKQVVDECTVPVLVIKDKEYC